MGNINQAVITLGGKGTRLKDITKSIPKPLWRIAGLSTLERSTKLLAKQGISNFVWLVGYMEHMFITEAKKLAHKYNVFIEVHVEEIAKGEAGALFDIIKLLDERFIFISGDIVFDIDIYRLIRFYDYNQADVCIVAHTTSHPEDSDCLIQSPSFTISEYKYKDQNTDKNGFYLGNSGIVVYSKKVIDSIIKNNLNSISNRKTQFSAFKDISVKAHTLGFNVFVYNTSEYLMDMGTPNRLIKIENDLSINKVENNSYRKVQRVLFIDRDNTIIKCKSKEYINNLDQLSLLEKRIVKIAKISRNYNFCLLISNQPQISMGFVTWDQVNIINGELICKCQRYGLEIAGYYICPHHPHRRYQGELMALKTNCFCRKPNPGMLLQATYDRNIDLSNSLFIGDSWRDKSLAENVSMPFLNALDLD